MQGHHHHHHHHHHLHHLQQQLAALLSAATGDAISSSSSAAASPLVAPEASGERADDAVRVAAVDSIQRAVLYPPNALLLPHCAPFLSQGLSQLLNDKSFAVRRAAAITYASLCAILSSTLLGSNGVQGHGLTLADHFVSWSLPLLGGIGIASGSAELALEGVRQFLTIGDANGIEHFVPPILKACQELLEDERTSSSLLHQLLGVLTFISLKFGHLLQPHFPDIVDLLLGWAFMPDLSESDRTIIMDSFLQFQNHWVNDRHFSLQLLSKFLGDIDVLIQDANLEIDSHLARLHALFSCFLTVLQVMASGMVEMNLQEEIKEPLESLTPRLLRCIALFILRFGLSRLDGEPLRCLVLLAEILNESFSKFYPLAVDFLFQSLKGTPSSQVHALLKTNLQLLSLQKLELLQSSVKTLLDFHSPLSQLRLHPNHLVVASSAANYLFFLHHGSDDIVSQTITSLLEELELLKLMLGEIHEHHAYLDKLHTEVVNKDFEPVPANGYSRNELLSLLKFDLKLLLNYVSFSVSESSVDVVTDTLRCERSARLVLFFLEKLNPFEPLISGCLELQTHIIKTLHILSEIEFTSKLPILKTFMKEDFGNLDGNYKGNLDSKNNLIIEYNRRYSPCIIRALSPSSPVSIKFEALEWLGTYGWMVMSVDKDIYLPTSFCRMHGDEVVNSDLLFAILDTAYVMDSKVRSRVASVMEVLLQARLINPLHFYYVSEVSLDKLGDSNLSVKDSFTRLLSIVLPLTIYSRGLLEGEGRFWKLLPTRFPNKFNLKWKEVLALKQFSRKLHSHQLVSVISYISQRSKLPLSSWVQRLVFSCRGKKDISSGKLETVGESGTTVMWNEAEETLLEDICSVSNLAAVWWLVHEAARHCIALRLRTNLGGPTQTFAAVERMLLDIPNLLILDAEHGDSKYSVSSGAHLLPMRLLLDFVEALKKNVYNAYEGSFVLPSSTRQSSLFFRANKKVCEEWFSRICEPMMNAGLALHCYDAAFQYCASKLQDLRTLVASNFRDKMRGSAVADNMHIRSKLADDVLRVVRHASLALYRNYEPEALSGLQTWVATQFSALFKDEKQHALGLTSNFGPFFWMTGIIYQAQGQFEKAAAFYSHLLQSEVALSSMGSDGVQFVIARVIECYTSISDWKSLDSWLVELQGLRAVHAGKGYSGALTTAGNEMNAVHALSRYDDRDFQAAWAFLDLTPKTSCEATLDPKVALERSEQMLLRSMLHMNVDTHKMREQLEKAKLMLDDALFALPLDGLSPAVASAIQFHCIDAFEESIRSNNQEQMKNPLSSLGSFHQVLCFPISKFCIDCGPWIKIFRVYSSLMPNSLETLLLCEKLLVIARKRNNFMLADRMGQYFKDHSLISSQSIHAEFLDLNFQYDDFLLKYAKGKHEEALMDVWSFVRENMLSSASVSSGAVSLLKAKACLKLSIWMRQGSSDSKLKNILLKMHGDFNGKDSVLSARSGQSSNICSLHPDVNYNELLEELIGTARKVSCQLCPMMGKPWLLYASWCFEQAKGSPPAGGAILQASSLSPILLPELTPDRFKLTEGEISKVETIIRKICSSAIANVPPPATDSELQFVHPDEDEAHVPSLVQQVVYVIQVGAGLPGYECYDGECPSTSLSSQLQALFIQSKVGMKNHEISPLIDELVTIWWSFRKRRVSLFGNAANGYFQYLKYSSNFPACSAYDVLMEKTRNYTLRAMLYLLHIVVNYGDELRETLESGLATVPPLPWQELIPQLFARLSSHRRQAVRKLLQALLMILAKLCPWSIVYPTLVDLNAYGGQSSEELQSLLGCLLKLHPKLVQDVQLVINELTSITVLWEELWLSTLQDLRTDVIRRVNMLKEEAARIAANSTLSEAEKIKINATKYSAMMAPIIVALERRLASTSREPRTVHEMWFQKEYAMQLRSAILGFKTPESAGTLGNVWQPFDNIAASLAHHRKSEIPLSEVAPQLASLSSSDVPMPGFEKQMFTLNSFGSSEADTHGILTISSFCEQLTILSTKTKPKKLVLRGSDGQVYTYLLKGREDLRLDARIMQLLQAINNIMHSCHDTHSRSLAIRYYSVTPISGCAGLIQWVGKVTSMYSVYKSWQIRAQLDQASAVDAGNLNNLVPPVPRPSDMYYGKIIPALKEKGIRRVISRRDWPLEVKRKVFLELMKETPRQLLWQEMWCASEGFRAFSLKAKRFSGSVAAMSIVGYILGLGDRHLDNILIDFYTGDIVHIDYNVCFDKGMRLKIPEIVPFRLTQIIEAALGLTGTEGVFRANCEAVMRLLKKNKDIILMLLEVFVWDPLVEWTRGESHDDAAIDGEEKKGMELAVSLSLFASRVQEIRVPLQEHHDLLLSALPAVESVLKSFLDMLNQYEVTSAIFYHAEKERSSLMQKETSAKSIVVELTSISEKARAIFEVQAHELAQAKNLMVEKAKEVVFWVDQHGRVLDALRSGAVPDAKWYLNFSGTKESISLLSAVLVSGVPLTIVPEPTHAQCYDLDREVSHLIADLDNGLSSAVEALNEYALALQRVLSIDYNTTSPVNGWAQVLQMSANNLSPDVLIHARKRAAELIAKNQVEGLDLVRQRHQDLLQKMDHYAMQIENITNERFELMNSTSSDTEAKYRERLISAVTNFMNSKSFPKKEDDMFQSLSSQSTLDGTNDLAVEGDFEQKKTKVLSILFLAAIELYKDVKAKTLNISSKFTLKYAWRSQDESQQADSLATLLEFEEQIERSVLIAGLIIEVKELLDVGFTGSSTTSDFPNVLSKSSWASGFQASAHLTKLLIEEITEIVLPEIIKSAVKYNSEMMEAFGILSQIRGSIDTALEKLVEIELERASLMELEKNYFMNVGLITEKQLALGEAALKGRDNLSWEEAEELASEEEACRAQINQLHQTWNQKDMRISALAKLESTVVNSLVSSQQYFTSMMNIEDGDLHARRSKAILASLAKPFTKLEAVDRMLLSYDAISSDSSGPFNLADLLASSSSLSESVWSFACLLRDQAFFVWKVSIMDNILDTCFHDISSSIGQSVDIDQLYSILKKKLENHLQQHVCHYLNGKVSIAFLLQLDKENENLQHMIEVSRDILSAQMNVDTGAVRRVRHMLEEYCNAHETAMAARSAISVMQRQINELTGALRRTVLEIVQMEWLYDLSSPYFPKGKILSGSVVDDDKLFPLILNLSRPNVLEKLQSSMSSIGRSLESLQACERNSSSVEGQLERAMAWACAGANIVGTSGSQNKTSGIPVEFHDHLLRRKQLLRAAQEHAAEITKVCASVMEFEASRDGLFWIPGEKSFGRTAADGRMWQQSYFSILKRLDVSYHSFTRAEQEWKLAEGNKEAAAAGLYSATSELHVASLKAKSASDDMQDIIATMMKHAYEVSAALSAFSHVSKGHTALTSECGSMLEEVLAVTEGLQDVYSLAKEASTAHSTLIADLTEAGRILLPLESSLSTDLASMADGSLADRESNKAVSPLQGQALYESYIHILREACQSLVTLVPSLTYNAKELHLLLTKLARTSSQHAGNLHKALEGLGESQVLRSQDHAMSSSELPDSTRLYNNKDKLAYGGSMEIIENMFTDGQISPLEEGWISPPEDVYTSSLDSSINSSETSFLGKSSCAEQNSQGDLPGENSTNGLEAKIDQILESEHRKEDSVIGHTIDFAPDLVEGVVVLSLSTESDENPSLNEMAEVKVKKADDSKEDNSISLQSIGIHGANRDPSLGNPSMRIERGKNAYALSVLKQVELKIDGGVVEDASSSKVAEQVEILLRQATNIDNLCNMYEGWTPWI